MVEQEITEVVAVRIDSGLFAQTGGTKKREGLKSFESGLAFGNSNRAACDWKMYKCMK